MNTSQPSLISTHSVCLGSTTTEGEYEDDASKFIEWIGRTVIGAAKEAEMLDMNEKTVRTWRKDFYTNHGGFTQMHA